MRAFSIEFLCFSFLWAPCFHFSFACTRKVFYQPNMCHLRIELCYLFRSSAPFESNDERVSACYLRKVRNTALRPHDVQQGVRIVVANRAQKRISTLSNH